MSNSGSGIGAVSMQARPGTEGGATDVDTEFDAKIARKFALRRWLGELYVGKRMKRHSLGRWLDRLSPPAGGRVLEVGSEDGCFTEWFDRSWPQATVEGLELDPAHAGACDRWAKKTNREPKLTFRQGSLLSLPEEPLYDLIFCLDVLGYIADDRLAVKKLASALKPGGRLIIHQPNRFYREFSGKIHDVTPEKAGQITRGHLRHGYTPEEMEALLLESGLKVDALERWHGVFSDLAHRVYSFCEHPQVLRIVALPILDALWLADTNLRWHLGNTVFAIGHKLAP